MKRNSGIQLWAVLVISFLTLVPSDARVRQKQKGCEQGRKIEMPAPLKGLSEQILYRKAYTVSYNSETKCPNWVAWQLTSEEAQGRLKRISGKAFREDTDVRTPRAVLEDYRGSGYDRGHMCPVGDCKWDAQAMYETYLLTNICPQDKKFNAGIWNDIEMASRRWAVKYGDIYIACGPIYMRKAHEVIGENEVPVPEAFFKVVVCLRGTPKGIGFICRNTDGKRKKDLYVNSIDEVERITGMDFFPALPDGVEKAVESQADLSLW